MLSKNYDEHFKKSIVPLYEIGRWVRLYSTVKTDEGEILTAKQVKAFFFARIQSH